jgi:hypothetical protein
VVWRLRCPVSDRTYVVTVPGIGEIRMLADNIADMRKRARVAFGQGADVRAERAAYRLCSACSSRPCCCRRE